MERLNLWAENGNGIVQTAGQNSSNNTLVQSSYPGSTVTVYNAGSNNLATIYSDNNGTSLANPFTASNNGLAYFYAASGRYDVKFSGNGIPSPFTLPDFAVGQIQSINNQTGENQTLVTGNAGSNFNIVSANNNHTFNLPQADANNNGYLSFSDWANFNGKAANYSFTAPLVNNNGNVSITLPLTIAQGGSNANSKTQAFDNLSPQANKGDLIAFNGSNAVALPIGNNGLFLIADGTNNNGLAWGPANFNSGNFSGVLPIVNGGTAGNNATQAFDNLSPITSKGDIIVGNNNNIAVRLPIGANDQSLIADGSNANGAKWGLVPLASGVSGALPIANGGTASTTQNAAFDALSPANSVGDLITRNSATGSRLPAGTNGQVLTANNANSLGLTWTNRSQVVTPYAISFNNASFNVNALTVDIPLFALSPFQKVTGVTTKAANLFLNNNNSLTDVSVSVGTGANNTLFTSAWPIGNNATVGNTNFQDTALWKSGNMGANDTVFAHFIAGNNNFGNGTATGLVSGNVTIWISVTTLQ